MNNILKFSVDNIELMDEIEDSLFRKARVRAFASGPNAHTLPISEEVLKRGARTIYNKPILWRYNEFLDDAMGHEVDEVPCGFVPKSEDNPITFEEDMGKTFIVINALLWTRYCGRLIEIFQRDDMKKDVSIEIATIENDTKVGDKPEIYDFVVSGITILGSFIAPACKGCRAELLEFSEDKNKYLNQFSNSIKINNSKDSAVDGSWSNPRRKLFNPISKASNSIALLKEAYLVGDFNTEKPEITKFKYPHHVIRNGELVLHKGGVQAAFSRAKQQGIVEGKVKSHLLRHYRELGMSTENFAEFGITKEEFEMYFADYFKNESVGVDGMSDKDKKMECGNSQKEMECKKEEEMECKGKDAEAEKMECEKKMEEGKDYAPEDERRDEEHLKEIEEKEDHDDDDDIDEDEDFCNFDFDAYCDPNQKGFNVDKAKKVFCKMQEKIKKLTEDYKAYMSKIDSMCDYADLKKFKEDTEKEIARQKELAEIKETFESIESRGIEMTDDYKKQLSAKVKEFSSVEAWSNFAKAQVLDHINSPDGVTKIGMAYATSQKKSGNSIWDRV